MNILYSQFSKVWYLSSLLSFQFICVYCGSCVFPLPCGSPPHSTCTSSVQFVCKSSLQFIHWVICSVFLMFLVCLFLVFVCAKPDILNSSVKQTSTVTVNCENHISWPHSFHYHEHDRCSFILSQTHILFHCHTVSIAHKWNLLKPSSDRSPHLLPAGPSGVALEQSDSEGAEFSSA